GARMIGDVLAEHIVKIWLLTDFSGGRHQARVDKILDVEKRYTK
ncbi:MAG: RpiB/LacA/LacB family sugar-phosphate isomerase, partial [Bacteroidetes bacterium]|nr:RpiB/LacA/LacB family sugar-phosphate isomerase [Bacteroidota bacterium]